MVVRNITESQVSPLTEQIARHNSKVIRGEGELGVEFARALKATAPYAGVYYVEALANVTTGAIEEILQPNPSRIYEREIVDMAGHRSTVSVNLSKQFPNARLAVFIVDAANPRRISDVVIREELSPEARLCLYRSLEDFSVLPEVKRKIA